MRSGTRPPHIGTGNDLQVAHDINFGVVTKIQYFWGNVRREDYLLVS